MRLTPDAPALESPRLLWYNPKLDPRTQLEKMTPAMRQACQDGDYDDGTVETSGPLCVPDAVHVYNLISSQCVDGEHRPALDLDTPTPEKLAALDALYGPVVVVASSTSGHLHAYCPYVSLSWSAYTAELMRLVELEVIEEAYRLASMNRGQTLLRPPWVAKRPTA